MSEYPETIYQVLELAEKCVLESEIPRELKEAVRFCIAKKMAWIQPATFVGYAPGAEHRLLGDRPTVIINPKPKKQTPLSKKFQETMVKNRLLILDEGEAVLTLHRERVRLPDAVTPNAKPADDSYLPFESVPEAAKRFKVDAKTLKRWIEAGKIKCEWGQGKRPKLRLLREDVRKHGGKVD